LALNSAHAIEQSAPTPTPTPSLLHRLLHPFERTAKSAPAAAPAATPAPAPSVVVSTPAPSAKPGFFHKLLHPFERSAGSGSVANLQAKKVKDLQLTMLVEPAQVQLAVTREIKVTLRLENRGRHLVQLQFSTAQRVDAKLTNKLGKVLAQWSEDQLFDNTPSFVSINPQERAEYVMMLSTRDLQPGELYDVTGLIVGYPDLQITKTISPVK
jgi:hypothetical protein